MSTETAGKRPHDDVDEENSRPLLVPKPNAAAAEKNDMMSIDDDKISMNLHDGGASIASDDDTPSETTNSRRNILLSSSTSELEEGDEEEEEARCDSKTERAVMMDRKMMMNDEDSWSESDVEGNDDKEAAAMQPLLRSISMAATCRSKKKTRLQDPPPLLTPAIQRQLTKCRTSTMFRKTESMKINYSDSPAGDQQQQPPMAMEEDEQEVELIIPPPPPPIVDHDNLQLDVDVDDDDIIPAKTKKKLQENMCLAYLQLFILILLVVFLVCSYKIQILSYQMFLGFHLWRWDALALVVFCGHLLSGWAVKLIAMLIERHYVLKKRVLYFVYGLRKSVKNCVWLALVLGVWESIHEGHESILLVQIVTKILWCLFTASVSWMLKVLAVKVAANSFHRKAYFERIQESVFNQHLLEVLSAPPRMEEEYMEGGAAAGKQSKKKSKKKSNKKKKKKIQFADADEQQQEEEVVVETGGGQQQQLQSSPPSTTYDRRTAKNVHPESPPAFTTVEVGELPVPDSSSSSSDPAGHASSNNNPRRAPLIARSPLPIAQNKLQELTADTVSVWTLKSLMKVVRKTNISTYSSMLSHHEAAKDGEINSESQAKAAAKQIFYNMARPGQKTLTINDFLRFLPEDQAMRAFTLFEVTESGEITKQSLAKWVIAVFNERRALALTLNDSRTVVAKLHRVLDVVLMLALIIVFLLIFGIETSKLLVFFTSIFIPSVFVFGNSARNTFEALIFLFIIHPFDVGDRVVVDGQGMLVEEMNVLNTVFLGPTSEKIYYPNSILTQKSITNYYRSPDQGDAIDFQVHMKTPVEKLGMLKERIQRYIEAFPQCWYPEFRIICDKIHDCNKVNLMIWIRHRINYQDIGERFQRRSNLLLYLKQQLEDLNIGYQLPNQEIMVTGIPLLKMP